MINKKAMFFTIMALLLLFLFMVAYASYAAINDRKAINKRIDTMNNFVFSVEEDLPRQLYIIGSRAMFLFEKRMAEKGEYVQNLSGVFEEIFYNGTFYGENQTLLLGAKFSDMESVIEQRADKINTNFTLVPNFISLEQDDPWRIKIVLGANFTLKDKSNLASWDRQGIFYTYISLGNFEDPLYTISTNGKIIHKINKTIFSNFVSGLDVSNLSLQVTDHYYIASEYAPSFLNRLQGNSSSSIYGIESLVYLPELTTQGILAQDKSVVDYIYFSNNNPGSSQVQGMPSWFKLDFQHLGVYNATAV